MYFHNLKIFLLVQELVLPLRLNTPDPAIFSAGKILVTVSASFTLLRKEPQENLNSSNADGLQNPSLGYLPVVLMISDLGRVRETETK